MTALHRSQSSTHTFSSTAHSPSVPQHTHLFCYSKAESCISIFFMVHSRQSHIPPRSSVTTCAPCGWLWMCADVMELPLPSLLPVPHVPCHSLTQHQFLYCRKRPWRGTGIYGEPCYLPFKTKSFGKTLPYAY